MEVADCGFCLSDPRGWRACLPVVCCVGGAAPKMGGKPGGFRPMGLTVNVEVDDSATKAAALAKTQKAGEKPGQAHGGGMPKAGGG